MAADADKPTLTAVVEILGELDTSDSSKRRYCIERLEQWATDGFPDGASRLILDHAARSFTPIDDYYATPNQQLVDLLWNGKTTVAGEDVEALFPRFDDACRASAIRLLAELGTRTASESLARILNVCVNAGLPNVAWPLFRPLERQPRDADVLIPSLLGLLDKAEAADPVHAVVLAYATAGLLTTEQSRVCAEVVAGRASQAIDDLNRRLGEHGPEGRWEDDYVALKTETGLLLDLLGRLDGPSAASVLTSALRAFEPWARLWGVLGLVRGGQSVPPDVLREIAAWPECRIALARNLASLERSDLFPNEFMNQPCLAEATMVEWLLYPTELGRAPDEIRQIESVPLETNAGLADLYVFAFRTHPPHWLSEKDWVVGVAGPFLVSRQPTFESLGATFSRFERLSEKSLDEHIEAILETVEGISGTEG